MAFDFKKEYKEFYLPPKRPQLVMVPPARYLAVRGQGDPNQTEGPYQQALSLLYAVAYTLKMSQRAGYRMEGFFDYVVPPLEGFWQLPDGRWDGDKSQFRWISVIRLPEFVQEADLRWARQQAAAKKGLDCSAVEWLPVDEGLCVQMMHLGSYDEEPASLAQMESFLAETGYETDLSDRRLHHEIYLSDARKVPPERRRTVLRLPIRPL